MFTGIVEAVGQIRAVLPGRTGVHAVIDCATLDLSDVKVGDSIAINGCCLTVVELERDALHVDISHETLACTSGFEADAKVNLEKALRLSDRLGGHLLSGHVDGRGEVTRVEAAGDNRLLQIGLPAELAKYVARKGSVAVHGVSLTVNRVDGERFEVNLIPHTLDVTNLSGLSKGALVNIEVDLLARYLERLQSESK